jgi:hypothetical protein
MGRLALALIVAAALVGGCGYRTEPAPGATSGGVVTDVPTSPAGFADKTPTTLVQRLVQHGRAFRGNPIPLGILTGIVLLAALGLGVYTLSLVRRQHRAGWP